MGAGTPIEHFYQDLAESFWVLECQKYLASLNINISSVEERQMEFDLYCVNHNPFPDGINPKEKFYSGRRYLVFMQVFFIIFNNIDITPSTRNEMTRIIRMLCLC